MSNKTHNDKLMERAFLLIDKGNDFESNENWWSAADSFGQAMSILESLSLVKDQSNQEQVKICQLYKRQSHQYRTKARSCFIKALSSENEKDVGQHKDDDAKQQPLCQLISQEEAERCVEIFSKLYSKESIKNNEAVATKQEEEKDMAEKQDSLEERFKELNASLPSGFKTSAERVQEINRGLKRLGLSLYSNDVAPREDDLIPPSEEEQVQEIMNQARDEVEVEKHTKQSQGNDASPQEQQESDDESDESDDLSLSSSSSMESEADEILGLHREKKRAVRKRIVKAQVHLAELVGLLDMKKTNEKKDNDESSVEEENDLDHFENGKRKLKQANKHLDRALKEWIKED